MNKEEIRRNATKNMEAINKIQWALKNTAMNLVNRNVEKAEWYYVREEDAYYCYLHKYEVVDGYDLPLYKYHAVRVNYHGLEVVMEQDQHERENNFYAVLKTAEAGSDVEKLLEILKARRAFFYEKLKKELAEGATKFLLAHEREICNHAIGIGGKNIETYQYIVWQCGASDEELKQAQKEDAVEIREALCHRFNYMGRENLKDYDKFYPCLFGNDDNLEEYFVLNENIDLIISRRVGYNDKLMYTPALYAQLIVKNRTFSRQSISNAYEMTLHAISSKEQCDKYAVFMNIVRSLESYNEWTIEDGKTVAYIPVFEDRYVDSIIDDASIMFKDEYEFARVVKDCSYLGGETTCIKVTSVEPIFNQNNFIPNEF